MEIKNNRAKKILHQIAIVLLRVVIIAEMILMMIVGVIVAVLFKPISWLLRSKERITDQE